MPKVERPVGGVLELSSVTSLYLFNASSIPPYCYVFYSHILTRWSMFGGRQQRVRRSSNNVYDGRQQRC